MRYPNLRYGNPAEFQYYALGWSIDDLSRYLRRSERTVKDWLEGKQRVPWWVPEVMRLKHQETAQYRRQMGYESLPAKLGGVSRCGVIELIPVKPMPTKNIEPKFTELRLDDFDLAPSVKQQAV